MHSAGGPIWDSRDGRPETQGWGDVINDYKFTSAFCRNGCRRRRGEDEDRRLEADLDLNEATGPFGCVDQDGLGRRRGPGGPGGRQSWPQHPLLLGSRRIGGASGNTRIWLLRRSMLRQRHEARSRDGCDLGPGNYAPRFWLRPSRLSGFVPAAVLRDRGDDVRGASRTSPTGRARVAGRCTPAVSFGVRGASASGPSCEPPS
jgi:hypothetical protein